MKRAVASRTPDVRTRIHSTWHAVLAAGLICLAASAAHGRSPAALDSMLLAQATPGASISQDPIAPPNPLPLISESPMSEEARGTSLASQAEPVVAVLRGCGGDAPSTNEHLAVIKPCASYCDDSAESQSLRSVLHAQQDPLAVRNNAAVPERSTAAAMSISRGESVLWLAFGVLACGLGIAGFRSSWPAMRLTNERRSGK